MQSTVGLFLEMMMSVRVTLLVDEELALRISMAIPHGMRRHLFKALIEMVVDAIEKDGDLMTAALVAKEYKLVPTREPVSTVSENGTR